MRKELKKHSNVMTPLPNGVADNPLPRTAMQIRTTLPMF